MEDSNSNKRLEKILYKYQKTKFESLSLEDLAIAVTNPRFPTLFNKVTGEDWVAQYQIKARERLSFAKYDIQWHTRQSKDQMKPLFVNTEKGDLKRVKDFMKLSGPRGRLEVLKSVDSTKKTPLHIACIKGHFEMAKFLVEEGFNVNARDRTLKTPLLYSCLHGELDILKYLIQNGAKVDALENGDKSALHLAATGFNPEMVRFLIKTDAKLVHQKDTSDLTPLHFSVQNLTNKQLEIMRILLENGSDPNSQDIDGATPLIHASRNGRVRAVKILLMNGASLGPMDRKTKKNALDSALNEKTRETIVLYGNSQYQPNQKLHNTQLTLRDKSLLEETLLIEKQKVNLTKDEEIIVEKAPRINILKKNNPENQVTPVSSFFRDKLYSLLKKLQEDGIQQWHHLESPSLFTASWMEEVRSLEDLYQMAQQISGQEIMIRIFNLLCPYEYKLPVPDTKDEFEKNDEFYGKKWFELISSTYHRQKLDLGGMKELDEWKEKVQHLEEALQIQQDENQLLEVKNEELMLEIAEYRRNKDFYDNSIKNASKQYETLVEKLKKQIKDNEDKIQDLEDEINKLKIENMQMKDKYENRIEEQEEIFKKKEDEYDEEVVDHNNTKKKAQQDLQAAQDELERLRKLQQEEVEKKKKEKMEVHQNPEDALIHMHKSIEQLEPYVDFKERMMQCDIDKNGSLTALEFMLFSERVKLAPIETKVLQKMAGILPDKPDKEAVKIEDFQDMAENHQTIKKIWSQRLFAKIIDKLQQRSLEYAKFCDKIDVNSSQKIEPKELFKALQTLKVLIEYKDLKVSFSSLDEDGNGAITSQEFQTVLEQYQKEIRDPLHPDLQFIHRFLPDHYDYQAPDFSGQAESEKFDGQIIENTQKRIKLTEDVEPINGNVMLQIKLGKCLLDFENLKQVTIRTLLKGSGAKEEDLVKSLILFDDKEWYYSLVIPVRKVLVENVNDNLHIQLFSQDDNFISDKNFLGEVKIQWKSCIENPEQWNVSCDFPLKNTSFPKEKPKKVQGSLQTQVKWIPSTSENFVGEIEKNVDMLQLQPTRKQFVRSIVEEGMLEVMVVSAHLQEKKKKVKIEIIMPDKSDKTFKAKYDANKQPYWGEKMFINLKEQTNKPLKAIHLKLFVDNGMLSSDEILGEVDIDWEECLDWVGDYQTRKAFLFKAHNQVVVPSKIYVKVRWIPNSIYQKLTGYGQGSEKDKKNQIKAGKEQLQCGVLKVIAIKARNLRADDGTTSDPYAKFTFINHDDKSLTYTTKTKGKTLNPTWNEQFTFNLSFFKDGPVPPLSITIKDKDFSADDDLGQVDIDLHDVVDQQCDWHYDDQFFEIEDPKYDPKKNPELPEFQLAVYWVPEGQQDPNKKPKNWRDDKTVKGTLKINVVHARDIKKADSKASDPYTIVKFPNEKEHETSVISNTLNPIWNEQFQETVLVSQERMDHDSVPIKITLKDSDTLAIDDVLGYCDIYWNECFKKPGEWAINEIFELQGSPDIKKNLKTLGYIYLQIKFLEEGMQDDDSKAVCIENLADIIAKQSGLYKGNLRVFLVHGKDLVKTDSGEKDFSDPYTVFKVPGGKKVQSKEIKDTLNPEWKTIYKIPLSMPMNTIQPMRLEVFDSDLIGNDLMGYSSIDLKDVLEKPNTWGINKSYKLQGDSDMKKKYKTENFGEIYMQIMFNPDGINNEDPPLPLNEDISEELRKKKEEAKKPMDGLLLLNVVFARGLKMADKNSSDPYCEVTFPNKKTISTKQIDADLNPIWNFQHRYMIKFNKEDYKPILFTVKDKDTMAVDDTLGKVSVPWMDCFENPTMWQVNQLFKLEGPSKTGEDLGDVYIQMCYIPQKDIENPQAFTICKTNPDLFNQYGRIMGNIEVKIISGLDLPNQDWGGKSDPFIEAYISKEKDKKLKTNIINNTQNPEWNFEGKFYIDFLRCQVKEKFLIFDLFDDDNLSSDFMGQSTIDVIECLEKPVEYYEQDLTIFDPKKKDSNTNLGTIKVGYRWVPDKDSENTDGLREPEKIIKGDIFVKVVNCKDFTKNIQSFVYFSVTNQPKKEYVTPKRKNKEKSPEYNHSETIKLEISDRKYKTLRTHFKVVEDGYLDSTLGGFTLQLRDIIDHPGKWINQYEKIKGKDEEKDFGYCYVQIQFRPEGNTEIKTEDPESIDYEKFINQGKPPTKPGNLFVNVVGARKIPTSALDKSDPFAKIMCTKGSNKTIKTKTLDDNLNPVWNHSDTFPLDLTEDDQQNIYLKCQVYDYDYASNDLLGQVEIDINTLFQKPGEWFNEIYPLLDEKNFPGAGEVYLQIQWRPDENKDIKTELPENKFNKEQEEQKKKEEEKKKKEEEENKIPDIEGQIYVKVVAAYNIIKSDTFGESDGIVILKVNKGTKQILQTQEIENNKNPKFDKELIFDIKAKPDQIQKDFRISATLEDVDTEGNDFLGYIEVDLVPFVKNPDNWFNQIQQLRDSKGTPGKNGLIYLQLQWRPKDLKNQKTDLPELLDIEHFYKGEKPEGFILVYVVSASKILGVEKKGASSDAKLKLNFNKNTQKTKIIKSLNPEWKEFFVFQIKFDDRSEMPYLNCELFDDNTFGDDFLGDFEADISSTLEKPDEWMIDQKYVFANLQKRKTKGDIDGTCQIRVAFCRTKTVVEKLKKV